MNARSCCRYALVEPLEGFNAARGLEARETKDREAAGEERARNWPGSAGARRARRPQRAMAGEQAPAKLEVQSSIEAARKGQRQQVRRQ